ncbi:MAG TPA: hypothetical protein VMV05_03345 [bacterium]|nr:hypothetical protein [bacterium]
MGEPIKPNAPDRSRDPFYSLGDPGRWFTFPASSLKTWAAILLAIPVLVFFGPILLTKDALVSIPNGDLANQFYAWRDFGFSELRQGRLSLWNPYTYGGAPFFAGFQSALLYPPNVIFLILPLVPALNLSIALHVFLAGYFTFLWLAGNRLGFLPALLGAFVFMFGGAYIAHLYPGHLPNLCAAAWIPLVFGSVEKLLDKPSAKTLLKGSAIFAFQLLSGHIQYFAYTLLLAGLYGLVLLVQYPGNRAPKILLSLGLLVTALGLTAVQWLPGLEAASGNLREALSTPQAGKYFSFHPSGLWSLFSSGQDGQESHLWWESNLYLGFFPFLLALYGFYQAPTPRKWLLGGLALLSLLLAMGYYLPFYPFLSRWIPLLGFFRGVSKFVIFTQLALAFLAGLGLQSLLAEKGPRSWPRYLGLSLGALGIAQLWYFASSCAPSFNSARLQEEAEYLKANLSPRLGEGRVFWSSHDDQALALRVPDIWGDDPFRPKRYSALLRYRDASIPESLPPQGVDPETYEPLYLTGPKMRLIRLAYLLESRDHQLAITPAPVPPLPRGFLVGKWRKVSAGEDTLRAVNSPDFDPGTEVLLENSPVPPPEPSSQGGSVSLRDITTDRVEVWAKTPKPQILVITDNMDRGWKSLALPDSSQREYALQVGDGFARAIPLSAGVHHFELRYEPLGFTIGKWVSLIFLLIYIGAWVWVLRLQPEEAALAS